MNLLFPPLMSNMKPSMKPALAFCWFLGSLFDPEDGGSMLLRNARAFLLDNTADKSTLVFPNYIRVSKKNIFADLLVRVGFKSFLHIYSTP
jgi:hypothetical protein